MRVEATVVGAAESAARSGSPWFARLYFGLRKPKFPVLGTDFAGTVERVGEGVTRFAPATACSAPPARRSARTPSS